jgi:DNA invertase Pin-like site-specific DNA recombinase
MEETAVAYIRVSDQRQVTNGNSLVSQEREVREYAVSKRYLLRRIFTEEGVTAKNDNRAVLQEMLAYLRLHKGRVQVVVFPKIDRFARYVADYMSLKATLKKLGIRLESVGERFEDSPSGRFSEVIIAAVAQFDNEVRAERCKSGMIEAVREGRWVWKTPLGYRSIRIGASEKKGGKGTIEPDPAVAPLVTELFSAIAAGRITQNRAREWLLKHGVTISPAGLYGLLRNRVYLGLIDSFGQSFQAQPPFVPLVTPAVFHAVQEIVRDKRSRTGSRAYERDNPAFPLRGCLRCSCGAFYTSNWCKGTHRRYPYYRCARCERINLLRSTVESAFFIELGSFRPHPPAVKRLREQVLVNWRADKRDGAERRRVRDKGLQELAELEAGIARKNALGVIPDDTARRQFQEISEARARLQYEAEERGAPETDPEELLQFAEDFLAAMPQFWRLSDLPRQKQLQSFLYPDGLVYTTDGSFRTEQYPLLEQVKGAVSRGDSTLVDPNSETTHEVMEFLSRLYNLFGPRQTDSSH